MDSIQLNDAELAARMMVANAIAREAGLTALQALAAAAGLAVAFKGPQDFVTNADRAVEKLIATRLAEAFPGDGFVGEEGGAADGFDWSRPLWIVDPIDGTANFAAGRPDWCVSIGFIQAGRVELGAIYQPVRDLLFCARRGHGATRNGETIRVSTRPLAEATIGLDYSVSCDPTTHVGQIIDVLASDADYRRNGSAAVSLCQVAEGTLDGFAEMRLNAWDVAAGIVLVEEAGGWCSDYFAGAEWPVGKAFVAATPTTKPLIADMLRQTGMPGGAEQVQA
jgi:myo-inositol-1(or 4)-monophosphatase